MFAKTGFRQAQPTSVDAPAFGTVYFGLHQVEQVGRLVGGGDGEIAACGGRFAQAALPHGTCGAVCGSGVVDVIGAVAVELVAGVEGQLLALKIGLRFASRRRRRRWRCCRGCDRKPAP